MKKFFPLLLCIVVFAIGYGLYWWKYTYLHDKLFRTAELHNEENGIKTKIPIKSKLQDLSLKEKQYRMQQNRGVDINSKKISKKARIVENINLLKDDQFKNELNNWHLWQLAKIFSNSVKFVNVTNKNFKSAVRIENPMKKLVGIQQGIKVKSNTVYRLSGIVRSVATNNNDIIFGGRIGFYLPGQKEKQIVWMSEHNQWWRKELIFTNQVTGIYPHGLRKRSEYR